MASYSFTGAEFHLEAVTQVALATIRVTYSQLPKIISTSGANDALNRANYTVVGPTTNSIANIGPVYGNPQQVDIFMSAPLTAGAWTVNVASNVQMVDNTTILDPKSLTFDVSLAATIGPVSGGATNDTDADIIRKHLNPALVGRGWDAIIAAIATGERTNRINAQLAYNQLFTSTSSGLYLARHGGDVGLTKPIDIGMSDSLYSQLIIKTSADKVTYEALLNILEIFYGEGSVRASISSTNAQPFFIQNGDDLTILVDENISVHTVFKDSDFAISGLAQATEIAAALVRSFELNNTTAYAVPYKDPETGNVLVTVFSGSTGLASSIRVTGGKAQNAIVFPQHLVLTTTLFPSWTITRVPGTNRFKFESYQAAAATNLNLRLLQVGDYVNIYGSEFNSHNRGSFPVLDVSYANDLVGTFIRQSFTIENPNGINSVGSIVQVSQFDINYFRPLRQSIYNLNQSSATLVQSGNGFTVNLPATSSAVDRTEFTAAYVQANAAVAITGMARNASGTITVTAPGHGLLPPVMSVLPTQQVIIDGAYFSLDAPTVTPGTGAGHSGTAAQSNATIVSPLLPTFGNGAEDTVLLTLASGKGFMAGGLNLHSSVITLRNNIELFTASTSHPVTYSWTPAGVVLPVAAAFMAGSLGNFHISTLEDRVILTGGSDTTSQTYANAYLYDPIGTISTLASMSLPHAGHGQSTLNNGMILVTGGVSTWNISTTVCEKFNGTTWTVTGALSQDRLQHGQVVLNDGTVLVTGGRSISIANSGQLLPATTSNYGKALNSCERYNGSTWTTVGAMGRSRFSHATILLPNGQVIVIGGLGYSPTSPPFNGIPLPLSSVELFDPATNRWRTLGNSLVAHGVPWAQLLVDTNEIIFGSSDSQLVEKLDINTYKFTVVTSIPTPSTGAQSTLLPGDLVLIAGGRIGGASVETNNLYISAADIFAEGGLNGFFTVESYIDTNSFTISTPGYEAYTVVSNVGATMIRCAAAPGSIAGPFVYDTQGGVAVTATLSTLTGSFAQGRQYGNVTVADATVFPDAPGWLCFDFGYENQVGPVKYFGKLSNTMLVLDDSFIFPKSVESGVTVTLLSGKAPYSPLNPERYGSFYVTDSPSGRIGAQASILSNSSAGVDITENVIFPGDRGLGGEGWPSKNSYKVSDVVTVWGSSDMDADEAQAEGRG